MLPELVFPEGVLLRLSLLFLLSLVGKLMRSETRVLTMTLAALLIYPHEVSLVVVFVSVIVLRLVDMVRIG